VPSAIPASAHDAITKPAPHPFTSQPAPAVTTPVPEAPRARTPSAAPPIEEIDEGWDLGDEDPTATSEAEQAAAAADAAMQRPEHEVPSASEMAGDSATGGDGIDEPGWD
jgi:hypothetical protein